MVNGDYGDSDNVSCHRLDAVITDPKTKTISLTLTGAPDLLNSLEPTDIGAANATGKAGVHEIPHHLPNFKPYGFGTSCC